MLGASTAGIIGMIVRSYPKHTAQPELHSKFEWTLEFGYYTEKALNMLNGKNPKSKENIFLCEMWFWLHSSRIWNDSTNQSRNWNSTQVDFSLKIFTFRKLTIRPKLTIEWWLRVSLWLVHPNKRTGGEQFIYFSQTMLTIFPIIVCVCVCVGPHCVPSNSAA